MPNEWAASEPKDNLVLYWFDTDGVFHLGDNVSVEDAAGALITSAFGDAVNLRLIGHDTAWLTEHDRAIREAAWEEGIEASTTGDNPLNPYRPVKSLLDSAARTGQVAGMHNTTEQ